MNAHTKKFWSSSGLLLISFVFLYWRVFETLSMQWRANVMYSHGFLIPLISLYLVWARRDRLAQIHYLPRHELAFAALGVGIGMALVGHVAGVQIIQGFSLIFTVTGIVVLLFGVLSLKIFWLPILYLLFMIPIWEEAVTGHFHLPFQKFSAISGDALLKLVGIPANREGLFITLPEIVLEVARACSGVNHLIAVIAIGIPLAYLFLSGWSRRILLILIAIVIAILSNGLRVALIGILSYLKIGGPLHGPFHIFQGLFVSVGGYVALILTAWALSAGSPSARHPVGNPVDKKETGGPGDTGGAQKNLKPHALFSAVIIFLAAGSYMNFHNFSPVPLKNSLALFPTHVGNWTGSPGDSPFSGWFKEANVDHELIRVYHTNGKQRIQLYIAYFENQDSTKKVINYRTGEIHQNLSVVKVNLESGEMLEINRFFQREKAKNSLALFWYDINGRILTSRLTAKLYRTWDGLLRGRTNGAIVILSSDLAPGEDSTVAEGQIKEFIRTVYPLFPDYLPGHKKESDQKEVLMGIPGGREG